MGLPSRSSFSTFIENPFRAVLAWISHTENPFRAAPSTFKRSRHWEVLYISLLCISTFWCTCTKSCVEGVPWLGQCAHETNNFKIIDLQYLPLLKDGIKVVDIQNLTNLNLHIEKLVHCFLWTKTSQICSSKEKLVLSNLWISKPPIPWGQSFSLEFHISEVPSIIVRAWW